MFIRTKYHGFYSYLCAKLVFYAEFDMARIMNFSRSPRKIFAKNQADLLFFDLIFY